MWKKGVTYYVAWQQWSFTCENNMLFSHVKTSFFVRKLTWHFDQWCLYNKAIYLKAMESWSSQYVLYIVGVFWWTPNVCEEPNAIIRTNLMSSDYCLVSGQFAGIITPNGSWFTHFPKTSDRVINIWQPLSLLQINTSAINSIWL